MALPLRSLLRWLAGSFAALCVAFLLAAAALPYFIEGPAVRASLVRSLSAWSGGPVRIDGALRANLASLSIGASGVRFSSARGIPPIQRLEAESVIAIPKISSLLRGRIEFKAIKVLAPKVYIARRPDRGIGAAAIARAAVAFVERSSFERLELLDCAFALSEGGRSPYRWLRAKEIRLDKPSPVSFSVKAERFEAAFRGSIDGGGEAANGAIHLTVAGRYPELQRSEQLIAPWEHSETVSLSGDLTWSGERVSLDGARLSFGDRKATGSLALATRHGRPLLEGTLAYDKLDWSNNGESSERGFAGWDALHDLMIHTAGSGRTLDLDMRISADRFSAGPYEAGPLAFALTSGSGHSSIDIAELGLFGGRMTGRLDYDLTNPDALTLNASAVRLDAASVTNALSLPLNVTGPASVRVAFDIPFGERSATEELRSVTGNFFIEFPSGGILTGGFSGQSATVMGGPTSLWSSEPNSIRFNSATINGIASQSNVSLEIESEYDGNRIGGSLHVALPGKSLSGTLSLTKDADGTGEANAEINPESAPPAHIDLSGTLAAVNVTLPGKPTLSN